MTQQYGYASVKSEEEDDDDDSLPPNWRRYHDSSLGRIVFRHAFTSETVLKRNDLFKKRRALNSPPKTTPTKKRKTVKKESTAPDTVSSSLPAYVTPMRGGTTISDPIELIHSDSSVSISEDLLPKTEDFHNMSRPDYDGSGSDDDDDETVV
jgi:hypothetical protein